MIKVGLTGGIASGKTTVTRIFRELGIPVYYADQRARELTETSDEIIVSIKKVFGENALIQGKPDRDYLRNVVFGNRELLEKLNAIVHPVVKNDFIQWCEKYMDVAYIIKEAAILYESSTYKDLDKTILVVADTDERIQRIKKRDKLDDIVIDQILKSQWPDEKKMILADFVIRNNEVDAILPQVMEIHKKLKLI